MTAKTRITRQDLKFFPSERLTDNDDGGGMPLGTPLSGEANELFDPIPSIARVNGAFYAHLAYLGVMRSDDEPLLGAFAAITKPPKDLSTSYLLFKATKYGELRKEILQRIENYSTRTIESLMTAMSTQSKYSKIVQAYQRVGEPLPTVGDVYCLHQDKDGYPKAEQYIQVTAVSSIDRVFTTPSGQEFTRTVVKMEISQKLDDDFIGIDYPVPTYADAPCKIRETHVADAAQYYGVKPLVEAIKKQTQQIRINGIMEKIIPTNQIETVLVDLTAAGERQTLFDGSRAGDDGVVTVAINTYHTSLRTYHLGNPAVEGSISFATNQGEITDKGGTLFLNAEPIGSASYARGEATINETSIRLNSVSFRPAATELRVSDTTKIDIEINNRSESYVTTIDPPPAQGSLIASYRAQGVWYDLRDDGSGALRGMSQAHGSGNMNAATGTTTITCGELPDVGSSILFAWANDARYFNRSDTEASAKMLMTLSDEADPASIKLKWNDGTEKVATCDAVGNITGDWTGRYDVATREIRIDTGANFQHPSGALEITTEYSKGEKTKQHHKAPLRGADGKITLDLGDKEIKPNTFAMRWNLLIEDYDHNAVHEDDMNVHFVDPYLIARDDGSGNVVDKDGINYGIVDYVNRSVKFNPDTTVLIPKAKYKKIAAGEIREQIGPATNAKTQVTPLYRNLFDGYEYIPAGASMPIDESAFVDIKFYDTSPTSAVTESLSSATIEIDLLQNFAEDIVPSSLNFTWGNKRYFDKAGSICTDLNAETGASTVAGTVNYTGNKALLTRWNWTNGTAPNVTSMATTIDGNPVDNVTFRTPSSPIRPGSLQVRATAVDGTKINATADFGGNITGANADGEVDAEYGVAYLRFGNLVDAVGNEAEDWFNSEAVKDGKIWKPLHVFAETITFNAVAYSYLPVDSTVVKIDTVRLPQNGKVPIFRRGDSILISNAVVDEIGSAHTGGQTVDLSRKDVDRICVGDADGKPINAELWDYDLKEATITWKTPLDLSDYKMPLKVKHVQEEKNRVRECDIDGTLSLIFPTKKDREYPVDGTYVSSLLIGGNLRVRHSVPFTQRNWNGEWLDEPVGKQLLNKLNLKDYPMILTDDGAIEESWVIIMQGTTQYELYGKTLGFVARGDFLEGIKPINPHTNKPYLTIDKEAFGNDAPWAPQDVIRFNTSATQMGVWFICAQQPTPDTQKGEDGFTACLYGDTTEII